MVTAGSRVKTARHRKPGAHSAKPGSAARGESKRSKAKPKIATRMNSYGPEQALRDSELRYRRLFESAQDGILILDAKTGAIDDVNPYLIDMLGYTREELLDKKLWEVGAFKDVEASKEAFEQLQKADYIRYHDLPLKAKDGRLVQVEFVSNVYRVDHKAVIQCNIRNTTERTLAQKALRASEDKLRSLFAGMTDVVIVFDADGRYLEIAPTNPVNLARPASEMLGKTVSEFFPPDESGFFLDHIRQALKTGQLVNAEYSLRFGERDRWFSATVSPLSSNSAIWVAHDITERKQAEAQIHYQAALLESVNDAIVASDAKYRLTAWNAAAEALYGWKAEQVLGQNGLEIMRTEWPEVDADRMRRAIAETGHWRGEATQVRKDGTRIPVEVSSMTLRDDRGQITGYVSANRDITERKRAEAELAQSHQQLRALTADWQTAMEDERANISREVHDEFGQSMTALKMDLRWLTKRLPEGDEKIERIRGMNTLVDDSIALMRRIATELRPAVLDDLGLNAALEWQAKEFSRRTAIPCTLNLPKNDLGLDPALCTSIFRTFQEALTNVSRHAQATRVDVSLRQEGHTVILTVGDDGRGISQSELADTRALGLLGLRERAAQWGGEITVRGTAGKGTTVSVRIPLPALRLIGGKR